CSGGEAAFSRARTPLRAARRGGIGEPSSEETPMLRAPLRLLVLALALTGLAACGQPSSTATATSSEAAAPAGTPDFTPEQAATEVAALTPPYNSADYEAGKRVFNQCRSCHAIEVDGGNRVGPNLHGLMGRAVGSKPGFSYSDALLHAGFIWDPDKL